MKEPEDDRRSHVALQRYEVISPLLNRPLPRGAQEMRRSPARCTAMRMVF